MKTSFPLYYYYLPNMIYTGFPLPANHAATFDNMGSNFTQKNSFVNHNWLGFYCTKKENSNTNNHDFKPIPIKTPQTENQIKNSPLELRDVEKRKYQKKKKSDKSEYIPNQKTEERKSNSAYLNEYRNILPNTIHKILSYIQRKNKSKAFIEKLIKKYAAERKVFKIQDLSSNDGSSQEISISRFYAYQNQMKNKLSNYVTLQTFKFLCTDLNIQHDSDIFSADEQRVYNKICRTAVLYYLKYEVVCVMMSSKRMQKDKKWQHLKVNRKIQSFIHSGFKEQTQ